MRPSPHPVLMSRVLLGLQLDDARGALSMRIRPTTHDFASIHPLGAFYAKSALITYMQYALRIIARL